MPQDLGRQLPENERVKNSAFPVGDRSDGQGEHRSILFERRERPLYLMMKGYFYSIIVNAGQ